MQRKEINKLTSLLSSRFPWSNTRVNQRTWKQLLSNAEFMRRERAHGPLECHYANGPFQCPCQQVGDTVYIPAGCYHQVRNLEPTRKVAEDFVHPTRLLLIQEIDEDIRNLAKAKSTPEYMHPMSEDLWQLSKMLLFASEALLAIRQRHHQQSSPGAAPAERSRLPSGESCTPQAAQAC